MTEQDLDVVRAFIAGLAAGTPTVLDSLDPAIEWHVEDTLPDPQVWHGPEGVEQFFAGLREVWRDLSFEADEYAGDGDRVFVALRQLGYGSGSEVPVEQQLYGVFRLRDGRIVRLDTYFDRDRALDALAQVE